MGGRGTCGQRLQPPEANGGSGPGPPTLKRFFLLKTHVFK